MRNIRLIVAYDGTDFHGFQVQPGLRTIQGELEAAIFKLTNETIQITGSGRTDAGVHAYRQVVNFHTVSRIPIEKWPIAMNTVLPPDIVVQTAEEVPIDFHARFDTKGKIYLYQIDLNAFPDVFHRRFAWHVPYRLELEAMQKAAKCLLGEHDFTSFCNAAAPVTDKVRRIESLTIKQTTNQLLQIQVHGNGFLWNMVRIIAGTLVDVGRGRLQAEQIPEHLAAKDRTKTGVTAPAHGLILRQVLYER